ncbi:MAG: hypothetical protein LCH32_12400 [Bacteroidetes bacterium]|nr:hypothetical protein [Bacteroidota bacterium]
MRYTMLFFIFLFWFTNSYSQKRVHVKYRPNHIHRRHVVVYKSPYRPRKVIVYHPVWHPAYAYNRRWVYFPKYNFYWDNWRNHYCYWNGTVWLSQPTPPPVIVNVDLSKEKQYELKESDDDNDSINVNNEAHKTEYKAE